MNGNDALGKVVIHNAKAQGLDGTFSATATLKSNIEVTLPHANYNATSDRLVYSGGEDLWLPDLVHLIFTNIK